MMPPANNAQKIASVLAAQNYHGLYIVSRNLHSIKAFHMEQTASTSNF